LREQRVTAARSVAGVEYVSVSRALPFWRKWSNNLYVAGIHTVLRLRQFELHAVSPDYFNLMGTSMLRGCCITIDRGQSCHREMPGAAYVTITPFSEAVTSQAQSWKLGATMFTAFGILALVLATIGLYSVIAYNVAQRTHEMGVRVALGAQVGDVIRMVVGEGAMLGVMGLVIGSAVALLAGRWVK